MKQDLVVKNSDINVVDFIFDALPIEMRVKPIRSHRSEGVLLATSHSPGCLPFRCYRMGRSTRQRMKNEKSLGCPQDFKTDGTK